MLGKIKPCNNNNIADALFVFLVHRQRLLFACMVWFTFMYFFWKLGDPFPILSPKHGN